MKKTVNNYKDLGQIILENANDLAKIGQAMQSNIYSAIPLSLCKKRLSYDEALDVVNKSNEPMCIVRIMYTIEKGQKFGVVMHGSSPLYMKKVVLGKEYESGLIRCSDVNNRRNVDQVHKSFIKML